MQKPQHQYIDFEGFLITIATGRCQKVWATYRIKENGLQRIRVTELPARGLFNEAQVDLDLYALKQGWSVSRPVSKTNLQRKD